MITATTDPITSHKIKEFDNAPYIVEGKGPHALKIYFENEASKLEYLSSPLHSPDDSRFDGYAKSGDSQRSRALN